MQKDSVWVKPLKKILSTTLLPVFSEAKGSQNEVKMGAKMDPQGTQDHKQSRKVNTQKNIKNVRLPKVGYCLHLGIKMG